MSAVVRSPNGATSKVRLRHTAQKRWLGSFTFPYSGAWTVKARGVSKQVLVQSPLAKPPSASTFVPLGQPGCVPPSPANNVSGEARGAATTGDLWAAGFNPNLAESHETALRDVVGQRYKILWRMLGSGDATFTAISPERLAIPPEVLQRHGGSNWNRPGDEWGSIFVFTQPGCWQIHVERFDNSGDLWLLVRS